MQKTENIGVLQIENKTGQKAKYRLQTGQKVKYRLQTVQLEDMHAG